MLLSPLLVALAIALGIAIDSKFRIHSHCRYSLEIITATVCLELRVYLRCALESFHRLLYMCTALSELLGIGTEL